MSQHHSNFLLLSFYIFLKSSWHNFVSCIYYSLDRKHSIIYSSNQSIYLLSLRLRSFYLCFNWLNDSTAFKDGEYAGMVIRQTFFLSSYSLIIMVLWILALPITHQNLKSILPNMLFLASITLPKKYLKTIESLVPLLAMMP